MHLSLKYISHGIAEIRVNNLLCLMINGAMVALIVPGESPFVSSFLSGFQGTPKQREAIEAWLMPYGDPREVAPEALELMLSEYSK